MKRLFSLSGALVLCGIMAGCATDSYEGLATDTIGLIDKAATEVGTIQTHVNDAVKKYNEGDKKNQLNLKPALDATLVLKGTGEDAQKIKGRIEHARGSITDDQKKRYAEN